MTRSARIVLAGVLALGIVMSSTISGGAVDDSTVINEWSYPRTNGEIVIWTQHNDIYTADIDEQIAHRLFPTDRWQNSVDISGNLIVWSENDPQPPDRLPDNHEIHAADLESGESFLIAESAYGGWSAQPAISGEYAVWIDPQRRVMVQNITTMDEPITVGAFVYGTTKGRPEIDGSTVVWGEQDSTSGAWRLSYATFSDREAPDPVVISESTDRAGLTKFNVSGSRIVYDDQHSNIWLYDTETGEQSIIATGERYPYPMLDERYIFWLNAPDDGADALGSQLTGYDTETESIFRPTVDGRPSGTGGGAIALVQGQQIFAGYISDLLPTAPRPEPEDDNPNRIFFPETSHNLVFGFKNFWEQSGGLPVFGFPMTEEFDERNPDTGEMHTVQYFERQRYEYHPEHADTVYEVLLGRLGVTDAEQRGLLDDPAFAPNSPDGSSDDGCLFFETTSHEVCGPFLEYWQSHGLDFGDDGTSFRESLGLFGYPISAEFEDPDTGLMVQYFERARFEHHPDHPDEHRVLLGRLSADLLEQRDW